MHGKSIGRTLFNWQVAENCKGITGCVLDLGSGKKPSYHRYLPKDIKIVSTDLVGDGEMVISVDLNNPLPFADRSQKNIFLFNSIYILEDRIKTLKEIFRILDAGGKLFVSSPFVNPEIPEPHDYCRLTYEGIERELRTAGFTDSTILRIGGRASAAASLVSPYLRFNFLRFLVFGFCLFLDRKTKKLDVKHPAPIMYFCIVQK